MAYHALLTENPAVAAAQSVLDAERLALANLPRAVEARNSSWEAKARSAVAANKPIPPRPAAEVTPSDWEAARTRVRLAEANLDDAHKSVADDVEVAAFARHEEIMEELAGALAMVAERSAELTTLGCTAILLDQARNLKTGRGGREHLTSPFDPVSLLKIVHRGGSFLDINSATPGPAGGAR